MRIRGFAAPSKNVQPAASPLSVVNRRSHRFPSIVMWWSLGTGGGFLAAGVGDRPSDEEPTGRVKERQAALSGRLAQPANDFVDVGFAPVASVGVHEGGAAVAFAVAGGGQAETAKEGVEFSAGAVRWWRRLGLRRDKARLWRARIRRVVNVDCPLVAVLRDDAWHHLVERVATLVAAGLNKCAIAGGHGSGFSTTVTVPEMLTELTGVDVADVSNGNSTPDIHPLGEENVLADDAEKKNPWLGEPEQILFEELHKAKDAARMAVVMLSVARHCPDWTEICSTASNEQTGPLAGSRSA